MADPVSIEQATAWLVSSPFNRFLGLTVEAVDSAAGTIAMRMPMRPEFERMAGTGQYHGGPVAAMIDTVGDFAVAVMVKGAVPTINFRVDYLRPCIGPFLLGRASVRRLGRTVGVVDIEVFDDQNRLCALGRGTYGAQVG